VWTETHAWRAGERQKDWIDDGREKTVEMSVGRMREGWMISVGRKRRVGKWKNRSVLQKLRGWIRSCPSITLSLNL